MATALTVVSLKRFVWLLALLYSVADSVRLCLNCKSEICASNTDFRLGFVQ